MSDRLDRILGVLDAGMQSSPEAAYGTDHAPGLCARCQRHAPAHGDICAGCRAFLLEDTDKDPAASHPDWWDDRPLRSVVVVSVNLRDVAPTITPEQAREILEGFGVLAEHVTAAIATIVDAFGEILLPIVEALGHMLRPSIEELAHVLEGIATVEPGEPDPLPPVRRTLATPDLRATEAPRRPPRLPWRHR